MESVLPKAAFRTDLGLGFQTSNSSLNSTISTDTLFCHFCAAALGIILPLLDAELEVQLYKC